MSTNEQLDFSIVNDHTRDREEDAVFLNLGDNSNFLEGFKGNITHKDSDQKRIGRQSYARSSATKSKQLLDTNEMQSEWLTTKCMPPNEQINFASPNQCKRAELVSQRNLIFNFNANDKAALKESDYLDDGSSVTNRVQRSLGISSIFNKNERMKNRGDGRNSDGYHTKQSSIKANKRCPLAWTSCFLHYASILNITVI